MRVVSLLPAATDIVAALGLTSALVGRTHECIGTDGSLDHVPVVTSTSLAPEGMTSREISEAVGADRAHGGSSLYALDGRTLAELAPDVVLTQELCDVCAVAYSRVAAAVRVASLDTTLVSLEPATLQEVLATIGTVGELLGVAARAAAVVEELRSRLADVAALLAGRPPRGVVCVEWLDPAWPVGHWVPDQVAAAGGVELLGTPGERTVGVEWSAVLACRPEVTVLMPCGFAPDRTLAEAAALDLDGLGEVWVVDGPASFNCPGPGVVRGVEVLARLLHGVPAGLALGPGEATRLR